MSSRNGFTLIEMAMVIVVIAVITGMGVGASMGAIEAARRAQTQTKMDQIEAALMRFREQNDRLPCPADQTLTSGTSYGKEITTSSACSTNGGSTPYNIDSAYDGFSVWEGAVPTATLGLPNSFMYDGWGRKFTYSVDGELALPYAFTVVGPRTTACGITVKTATAGATRSSNAIYALVSHGSNGHGAFLNASRINTGATHADELTNCRCNTAAALYSEPVHSATANTAIFVQRDPIDSTGVGGFDDIVRYKERWQMMTDADAVEAANYSEAQLGVVYASGTSMYRYKKSCHFWTASVNAAAPSLAAGNYVYGVHFKSDNTGALACTRSSKTLTCRPYSYAYSGASANTAGVIGATYPVAGTTFTPTALSGAAADPVMSNMTSNGYVATAIDTPPYINIYKNQGTVYSSLNSALYYGFVAAADYPSGQPTIIRFSKNAEFMVATNQADYASFWARYDDKRFKRLGIEPDLAGSICTDYGRISGVEFSPDGKYLFVVCLTDPSIYVLKIQPGNPFTGASEVIASSPIDAGDMASLSLSADFSIFGFSPDSQYVAFAAQGVSAAGDSMDYISIYRINNTNDTFTSVTVSGNWISNSVSRVDGAPIVFTKDSNFLLVPVAHATGAGIAVFRRYSPTEFRYVSSTINGTATGSEKMSPFYSATLSVYKMAIVTN